MSETLPPAARSDAGGGGAAAMAVARLDETSGQREEWIFDRKTHVFLGERIVQVKQDEGGDGLLRPGTVIHTSAILKRVVADAMEQPPSQAG
ncbi:hypothetical protein U5640_42715 [Streptomyces sp. SS7]|uniref:hypothetical protein n=1 Tax=Streptomyces sp. SS7 TaxID=3108485 RepID=UPI0030ED9946